MKLLLDTHVLLWASEESDRLSTAARRLLDDPANEVLFSPVSIWEIAIKHGLRRDDFRVEPQILWRGLIDNGYGELELTSRHAMAIRMLPPIHKDPFDRILLAQAQAEGVTFVTADPILARYPGPVQKV